MRIVGEAVRAAKREQRGTATSPGETTPHARSTAYYRRRETRRAHVLHGHTDRPRLHHVAGLGYGRRNPTVKSCREFAANAFGLGVSMVKQPGRRYGPSPEFVPHSASTRMEYGHRVRHYAAQNGYARLTDRQRKRAGKKARRNNREAQAA
jgi:hypothetical protein